jgi:ring-1,2-phenylacetyl-CoA epoxidase subunit PaaC
LNFESFLMNNPLKNFLYKTADDQLIFGHRNSEWTGFGPLLEEDIAFSSMAQDKIGHSLAIYSMLHQLGEADPDAIAFTRNSKEFKNCQLVELPNGDYDFSLVRHFLFDTAEALRFEMLTRSSYKPLAELSVKIKGEIRYHTMHANYWLKKLGTATEESKSRMQHSLNIVLPFALGIFEKSVFESDLIQENIFEGEDVLKEKWKARVEEVLSETELTLPDWSSLNPHEGGRRGIHTEHLQPLIDEMGEVFRSDPTAEW